MSESEVESQSLIPKEKGSVRDTERLESLKGMVEQIQSVLEETNGLKELGLERASHFLYPEVISSLVEHNLTRWGDFRGFFVTDEYSEEASRRRVARFRQRKETFRKRLLGEFPQRQEERRKGLLGRLLPWPSIFRGKPEEFPKPSFTDFHPVIYISPRLLEKTKGITSPSEMLKEDKIEALDAIAEETSHFLYSQTQYLLHGERPGDVIGEGMALVDFYQLLKRISDLQDPEAKKAIRYFNDKIDLRREIRGKFMERLDYHPTAATYTKSLEVMGGFIKHLLAREKEGEDTTQELRIFYRLSGPEKARYLRVLYQEYVRKGDNFYQEFLAGVEDKIRFGGWEFEDEENWREKAEEARREGGTAWDY